MKNKGLLILLGILAVLFFFGCNSYNGMATLKNDINGKWGEVENQFQRKAKFYESAVSTVKGAARNEDTTLIKIVQMRSRIPNISPSQDNIKELEAASKQYDNLGKAMMNINFEAYPTLKATDLYAKLQDQVEGTENRVSRAIGEWNNSVTTYNGKRVVFPNNILSSFFGFGEIKNYKSDEGAKDKTVDFSK
jgi:LemA protein